MNSATTAVELLALGVGRGVFRVLDVVEIATFDGVSEAVALAVLLEPRVDDLSELGILFAKRDGQVAAGSHGDVLVHVDTGEHLAPELGQVVVHDGDWSEAGVDHLEHVIVLEDGGGLDEHGRRLAARLQLLVQLDEALLIDAPFADEHLLTGEIVHRGDRRRAWPGDHDFAHIGARRLREGRELLQLGPDGHHGRDHVHLAARQSGVQLIARHRHDHHVHLEVAGLQSPSFRSFSNSFKAS